MNDRCAIPGCRTEADVTYLGRGVCSRHWNEFMDESQPPGALAAALGIHVVETATTEDCIMSEKKAENTKSKKTKTVKEPKPKKERAPKEATRTFAIRITDAELAAIHKAAGPRNATRLVRAVCAAFAAEDDAAFRALLKEAREARA